MGHLDQDSCSVSSIRLATAGAAMSQVIQDGQALLDNVVGGDAFDIDNKPRPTGVMFELRVIQALVSW